MQSIHHFFKILLVCLFVTTAHSQVATHTPLLEPSLTMKTETRYVVYAIEQLHYKNHPIHSINMDEFIESYMGDLDNNRMFFYQTDIDDYKRRFASILPVYLRQQGNLYPAFEIFKHYKKTALERIQWVHTRLEQPFDFNTQLTFKADRRKELWPHDAPSMHDLWERRLKYELLNEILADSTPKDADSKQKRKPKEENFNNFEERLQKAKDAIHQRYNRFEESLESIDAPDIQEIFLTSLTHMYDPHSTFWTSDTLEEFSIAIKNSLVGIGAMLADEEGYCTIKELLPGGPAEKSKQIQPTDKIVGIGQEEGPIIDVVGMRLKNVVKLIRGKKQTPVRLLIQPANGDPSSRKIITLVRDEIKLTSKLAKAKLYTLPNNKETMLIGLIDLPAFYGSSEEEKDNNTTQDVTELIKKLQDLGAQGIILDLRRNAGGLLSEAISLTGLFIQSGPIVQAKDASGEISEYRDYDNQVVWKGPLLVMVSRYSASAAEIVAGALNNHHRALIVGDESTHGKGTVQGVFEMDRSLFNRLNKPKMGAAKITIQKWYLPDGNSIQEKGVKPDIILPSINVYLPIQESDLPLHLGWDAIQPMDWDFTQSIHTYSYPVNEQLVTFLGQKSIERQNTLPEFQYLLDIIEWFKKNQDQKDFSLNFEKRKQQRTLDNQFWNKMDTRKELLTKDTPSYQEILLDISSANTPTPPTTLEEEDTDEVDIHLRESLRIMKDWLMHTSASAK